MIEFQKKARFQDFGGHFPEHSGSSRRLRLAVLCLNLLLDDRHYRGAFKRQKIEFFSMYQSHAKQVSRG